MNILIILSINDKELFVKMVKQLVFIYLSEL
jgi:hypothetical protein